MAERRLLARAGACAALALALAGASPGAGEAAGPQVQIAKGRAALARGDGIAAEAAFKSALASGAAREEVAAGMGEALLDQGLPHLARDWLGTAGFVPGEAIHGLRMLARLERVDGHPDAARTALERALALDGRNAEVWVDIAQLRYASGEQAQAVEAADAALAADGQSARALHLRGLLVRDVYGPEASLAWFEAALMRDPRNGVVLGDYAASLGELGRAKDMLVVTRRMIETGANASRAWFLQAVLAARAGNVALARAMLNRLGDDPRGAAALLLDGLLDLMAGNANLASQDFDRLTNLQPYNETARLLLGLALAAAGENAGLVRRLAPFAERADAPPYELLLVGRAFEELGQREEAARFLDRAAQAGGGGLTPMPETGAIAELAARFQAHPRDADAAAALTRALIGAGRAGDAVPVTDRLRNAFPGMVAARTLAGDARFATGDFGAATAFYSQSAAIRCDDALLTKMALALAASGKRTEAAVVVTSYLAAHRNSRAAIRLSADYAAAIGDRERALALLEHLRRTGSGRDARLMADLALARLANGDAAGAESAARAAFGLQRANPFALRAWTTVRKASGAPDVSY